jgi:hypothetical protein
MYSELVLNKKKFNIKRYEENLVRLEMNFSSVKNSSKTFFENRCCSILYEFLECKRGTKLEDSINIWLLPYGIF